MALSRTFNPYFIIMARPQKNNLDYFSHDKDMRNDIKIKALRRKFSHKGYSIYVMMLEHLSNYDYLQFEWNDLNIELLTPDFDIDLNELIDIINYAVKLKLFEIEVGYIYCPNMLLRNQHILSDRKCFDLINSPINKLKRDLLNKSPINSGETPLPDSKTGINTHSIVQESIVQESIVQESIVQESIVKESKLQPWQVTMLKKSIIDVKVPEDVKYCLECIIDNINTPKQVERVLEYKTILNKITGVKDLLETIKY